MFKLVNSNKWFGVFLGFLRWFDVFQRTNLFLQNHLPALYIINSTKCLFFFLGLSKLDFGVNLKIIL